jgi:hypothetical protein
MSDLKLLAEALKSLKDERTDFDPARLLRELVDPNVNWTSRCDCALFGYRAAMEQQKRTFGELLEETKLQALQARIQELEKALSRYGRHEPSCDCIDICDCGLDKALNP